jgi:two-component system phosphate regulon response regulator PhoB
LPNTGLRSARVADEATVVLVIDDDPQVRTLVARLLRHEGYDVVEAGDAGEALRHVDQREPDLVLLDVVMPQVDGIDLLAEIRTRSNVPVIMLTALGDEADRILGLKSGADDYMVKPFSPGELSARIESVLRRSQMSPGTAPGAAADTLTFGELEIDPRTRDVKVNGLLVELTAREFDLLLFLASSPRQVFDRQQLLTQVWQSSADWQDPATVTEHVRRIRRKLESDPDRPRWLKTVRGVGYRFEP